MTMREHELLKKEMSATLDMLQVLADKYNVTFEGTLQMTTREPDFNDRLFVSTGFKFEPKQV